MKQQLDLLFILITLIFAVGCGHSKGPSSNTSGQKVALVKAADGTYYKYYCLKGKSAEQMSDCAVDPAAVNSAQANRGFLGGGDALTSYLLFNLLGYPQQQVCGFLWNTPECYQNNFLFDPGSIPTTPPPQCIASPNPGPNSLFDPFAMFLAREILQISGCFEPLTEILPNTISVQRWHRDQTDGKRDYLFFGRILVDNDEIRRRFPNAVADGIRFRVFPDAQGAFNVALHSCITLRNTAKETHFLSLDSRCEGQDVDRFIGLIGYISASQQPNTIGLHRWGNVLTGAMQHVILQQLPSEARTAGWRDHGIVGYVPQY